MKITKICKNAFLLGMAGAMTFAAVNCGPGYAPDPNAGKTKILVSLYAGGHGTAYFEQLVADFMAKNPEYNEEYCYLWASAKCFRYWFIRIYANKRRSR